MESSAGMKPPEKNTERHQPTGRCLFAFHSIAVERLPRGFLFSFLPVRPPS
nr:MAG TPA_asm: hypothetical protein [Caudoviricetes sp.]